MHLDVSSGVLRRRLYFQQYLRRDTCASTSAGTTGGRTRRDCRLEIAGVRLIVICN